MLKQISLQINLDISSR